MRVNVIVIVEPSWQRREQGSRAERGCNVESVLGIASTAVVGPLFDRVRRLGGLKSALDTFDHEIAGHLG